MALLKTVAARGALFSRRWAGRDACRPKWPMASRATHALPPVQSAMSVFSVNRQLSVDSMGEFGEGVGRHSMYGGGVGKRNCNVGAYLGVHAALGTMVSTPRAAPSSLVPMALRQELLDLHESDHIVNSVHNLAVKYGMKKEVRRNVVG